MRRKTIPAIILCVTLVLLYVSPGNALFESDVAKAKNHIKANRTPQAIELLTERINKTPDDAEAHFVLGTCYLKQGNYRSAQERFNSAIELEPDYSNKTGKEYKETAYDAFKTGSPAIAGILFEKAEKYDSGINKEAYDFFVMLGDAMGDSSAIIYYDKALMYTNDKYLREQIGYRILKMALNSSSGSQYKKLKSKAVALLGQKKVDEVFPRPFRKTVFERTYTNADIDSTRGNIVAFTWTDKFKKGDLVEISGYIPADSPEIAIYLGEHFDPQWKSTENGSLSYSIEKIPPAGSYYLVRIEKNIEFTLRVTRKIAPKPNEDLLRSYIK
jgi:tetratricopeptide (TPR) repeat protein